MNCALLHVDSTGHKRIQPNYKNLPGCKRSYTNTFEAKSVFATYLCKQHAGEENHIICPTCGIKTYCPSCDSCMIPYCKGCTLPTRKKSPMLSIDSLFCSEALTKPSPILELDEEDDASSPPHMPASPCTPTVSIPTSEFESSEGEPEPSDGETINTTESE